MIRFEWGVGGLVLAALALGAWQRALWASAGAARRSRVRVWTAAGLGGAATLLLVAALVGPVVDSRPAERPARALHIHLAVDLSRSMAAGGEVVSRLELARSAARRVLATVPGAAVSLTVFGEGAWPLLPPTRDPAVVAHYLDALSVDGLSARGTGWTAVEAAIQPPGGMPVAGEAGGPYRRGRGETGTRVYPFPPSVVTLLITDGEWWGASGGSAGSTPVHVIWADAPGEAPVPGPERGRSRASDRGPRQVAERSGGRVVSATDLQGLDGLGAELARQAALLGEPAPGEVPVDGAPILAGAAALLTLLAGAVRVRA
jgi:hypothetical protein